MDKYAVAFQLKIGERFVFGQRQASKLEYPNWWSLPSSSIDRELFESATLHGVFPEDDAERILKRKLGIGVSSTATIIARSTRQRSSYKLHMLLVSAAIEGEIPSSTEKYPAIRLLKIAELLILTNKRVSTCVSTLLQALAEKEQLAPDPSVLELSPELANSLDSLEAYTPEQLWRQASPNYGLLLSGELGCDGYLIRQNTIDRHLRLLVHRFLARKATSALDLGCGTGSLVHYMNEMGLNAVGLDINPPSSSEFDTSHIFQGNIFEAQQVFSSITFDLLFANLLCEWLADVDQFASSTSQLLSPGGTIVITVQPPEFTKNGRWLLSDRPEMVIQEPTRRKPFLTMLNRGVGPLWYYPHTTPQLLTSFGCAGLLAKHSEYIFLDSHLKDAEAEALLDDKPYLRRLISFPIFLVLEFVKEVRVN